MLFAFEKAQNPIILFFGNGPAKSEMQFLESVYVFFFYRYGFIGLLLLYFFPLFTAVLLAFDRLKNLTVYSMAYPFYLSVFLWFLVGPLMMIGNNFTEQVRLSFMYYSIIGVMIGDRVSRERTSL